MRNIVWEPVTYHGLPAIRASVTEGGRVLRAQVHFTGNEPPFAFWLTLAEISHAIARELRRIE